MASRRESSLWRQCLRSSLWDLPDRPPFFRVVGNLKKLVPVQFSPIKYKIARILKKHLHIRPMWIPLWPVPVPSVFRVLLAQATGRGESPSGGTGLETQWNDRFDSFATWQFLTGTM